MVSDRKILQKFHILFLYNEVSLFDFQSNDNVMKKEKMLMITGLNTPRTMHLIYFKKIFYQTPLFL